MMTDPIADMLTRMRNALRIKASTFTVPGSTLKVRVLDVLKREGYIEAYEIHSDGPRSVINVTLKYGSDGEMVVSALRRFSKPGCRRFRGVQEIPKVRGGLGIAVVSTNQGVLSDRECRQKKVGGEVLCTVE
ncbi:MAG: 30S ribosomal protein S8 [Planctomycetota bacterium]|jgi:small subunit ribosomal protein S8